MYENIAGLKLERRGRVLVISINNPPMNAVTILMHTDLSFIFGGINRDPDTAVVVLTGAGDAFSAGGNINTMAARAYIEQCHRHATAGRARSIAA